LAKRNTRQRILDTSLVLFNQHGAPNISTNTIANELEISPGNLYYHFSSREMIISELFSRFEQAMLDVTVLPDDRLINAEDIWLYLHLIFEQQIEYRFWYRDLNELSGSYPALKKRFQALLALQQQTTQTLINRLAETGVLSANPLERATLTRNILLTLNCWLGYSAIAIDPLSQNPNLAVWQVISQVCAYLVPEQRQQVEQLASLYLQ